MGTADNGEAEGAFLFALDGGRRGLARPRRGGLGLFAADAAELFGVGENKVHVLVKGEHLAGHLAAVVERDAHAVVDLGVLVG